MLCVCRSIQSSIKNSESIRHKTSNPSAREEVGERGPLRESLPPPCTDDPPHFGGSAAATHRRPVGNPDWEARWRHSQSRRRQCGVVVADWWTEGSPSGSVLAHINVCVRACRAVVTGGWPAVARIRLAGGRRRAGTIGKATQPTSIHAHARCA